jgi:hypothetical protein
VRLHLGIVGEGMCVIDKAQPLTQLRLIRCAHKSAQPSPHRRGIRNIAIPRAHTLP